MSQAPPYTRSAQFADDERDNAGGRSTVNTADVDAELDAISTSVNALVHNQSLNQRDDGEIRDQRVKLHTLAPDVLALLVSLGANIRGAWLTATNYGVKDVVQQSGNTYIAVSAHTSGTFATDLAAGKWLLLALGANPTASAIAFISTAGVSASNVQTAIEEVDTEYRAADAALVARLIEPASASNGAGMMSFSSALSYAAGTIGKAVKDFIASIASYASGSVGAGLVGYSDSNTYAANTVGAALKGNSSYVFTGSGELGDDTAAIAAYYASLPRYSRLKIKGLVRVTSTTTFGRQIDIICESSSDGFVVDVGTGNDGIVIKQATALDEGGVDTVGGINGIELKLHVFGKANACKRALVITRLDRSVGVYTWVYAGATEYGLVVDGCLINNWTVQSSIYVKPPITSPAFQVDHMLVQKNTTYTVASNTNKFRVNLEGGRHAYVQTAQGGEGANTVEGEMEALTGRPLTVSAALGFTVHDLKMEVCALQSTIDGVENLHIGPGVVNFASTTPWVGPGKIKITNSQSVYVGGYYGSLDIDDTNIGVELGAVESPLPDSHTLNCRSMVQTGVFTNSTTRTTFAGPGAPTMENVFLNPYLDLYAGSGTSAPPLGCASTGLVSRVATPLYPGNPTPYSCRVTTTGNAIGDALIASVGFNPVQEDGYMSAFVPVYIATGQPGAIVFIFNGVTFYQIGAFVGGDNAWHEFRGSAPMLVGQNVKVYVMSWNGTTYVNGAQFFVGGCTMCFGPIPPKHLADHGRRAANNIATIANTPDFSGQRAVTGGGVYFAQGNASSADWKGPV